MTKVLLFILLSVGLTLSKRTTKSSSTTKSTTAKGWTVTKSTTAKGWTYATKTTTAKGWTYATKTTTAKSGTSSITESTSASNAVNLNSVVSTDIGYGCLPVTQCEVNTTETCSDGKFLVHHHGDKILCCVFNFGLEVEKNTL